MNAKEELSQYKFKVKRVYEALEEYERFKDRATKMTAAFWETTGRTNITSDKVGENAAALADLKAEWEKRWIEAERELFIEE